MMTSMLRRLFTLVSALSLILCAATCALWVRSYVRKDAVLIPISSKPHQQTYATPFGYSETFHDNVNTNAYIASSRATLWFVCLTYTQGGRSPTFRWRTGRAEELDQREDLRSPSYRRTAALGFTLYRGRKFFRLGVPVWSIAAGAAILPTVWFVRRKRMRRHLQAGLCPVCGYDLRATPDRCPECGTGIPARLAHK